MQALRIGIAALIAFAILLGASTETSAKNHRSSRAKAAFIAANPCPVAPTPHRKCPGHVVDHIDPLCAGGRDLPENMQWQTIEAAHQKDLGEWATCRKLRLEKNKAPPLDMR